MDNGFYLVMDEDKRIEAFIRNQMPKGKTQRRLLQDKGDWAYVGQDSQKGLILLLCFGLEGDEGKRLFRVKDFAKNLTGLRMLQAHMANGAMQIPGSCYDMANTILKKVLLNIQNGVPLSDHGHLTFFEAKANENPN